MCVEEADGGEGRRAKGSGRGDGRTGKKGKGGVVWRGRRSGQGGVNVTLEHRLLRSVYPHPASRPEPLLRSVYCGASRWRGWAGAGCQVGTPIGPQRASRFGVPRAGPGGGKPDVKSSRFLNVNGTLDLPTRGLVRGGGREAGRQIYALVETQRAPRFGIPRAGLGGGCGTPNLGTC